MKIIKSTLLINTCLLAGKIMISAGSETYRVEDTIQRIAHNAGVGDEDLFTLPTGIFISDRRNNIMQLRAIYHRSINLKKIDQVNNLSRLFEQNQITLEQLYHRLKQLDRDKSNFPLWLQLIGVAVISSMMVLICTDKYDFIDMPAAIAGVGGYLINYYFDNWFHISFLNQFLAAFGIGIIGLLLVNFHLAVDINNIIIGAVMPLVPGVAITNACRDLLAGHLLTSVAHAIEAILCATAIGTGVALVFYIFR